MAKIKTTGIAEIDALFADAKPPKKEKKPKVIELPSTVDYVDVSDERVKPDGELQNSGIKADNGAVLVPHMSQEELENNTPANGKGMVRVEPPEGISLQTFYTLLSNSYALYLTTGNYDNEALQQRTGLAPGSISKTLSSPQFKHALRLRGVHPNATGLTREQDLVLLTLTDPSDGKTLGAKLKACGVSFATYRAWLKQPVFKAQIDAMTGDLLSDNSQSLVQLEKLVGLGDLGAIKYKHELNGLYDPNRQNNIDVMALMSMMMDIIMRNTSSAAEQQAIASEFKDIAQQLKLGTKAIGA